MIYYCPSVRGPTIFKYNQAGAANQDRSMMDYTGNGGTWGSYSAASGNALDGPIVPTFSASNKKRRILDIKDGASNTLLIARSTSPATPSSEWVPRGNDDQGYVDGWDNDTICYSNGDNGNDSGTGTKLHRPAMINLATRAAPAATTSAPRTPMAAWWCSSMAPSTRSTYTINRLAWQRLCSINDGQILDMADVN